MDYSTILDSSKVFNVIVIISIIIIVIYLLFALFKLMHSKKVKIDENSVIKDLGIIGEDEVEGILLTLDGDEYVVLRDLILMNDNTTHQIDHVVVSNYGIFIIETKNYSGFVKGSDKYTKWIQYIGKKKYLFLNPVIQNKGHIKALKNYFPEYSSYFVPIVCFTDKTKLRVDSKSIVVNSSELLDVIYNYKTEILIPDINEVAQNLTNISLHNMNGIDEDHRDNINKYRHG